MWDVQSLFALLLGDQGGISDGDLASTETTSTTGSNETDLLSGGIESAHSRRVTNVLMVTSSVGMLDGLKGCGKNGRSLMFFSTKEETHIHRHTSDLGPLVTLHAVLVP